MDRELSLNEEQKTAIQHTDGPLLIVAGAGTGKTTVITQRILHLIKNNLAKPDEILALTFTEKAASEMEERVDRLLDFGYVNLWIMTFHAFCEKVLREHGLDIGLSTDFKLLDTSSSWLLFRQNFEKFHFNYYKSLGNPFKLIRSILSHFSRCKDQEISPEKYLEYAESLKIRDDMPEDQEIERLKEVAECYHTWQRILLENNSLEFGDLINYCLKLFKERPLILEKYREKFNYILVDEFQDTNWAQYELVKILALPKNNLVVCADDDQAIYRWRGASFSNIINFSNDFPKAKKVSLIKNYRSPQNILDCSYTFIQQNNPDRLEYVENINKKLESGIKEDGLIFHANESTLDEEAAFVVDKIIEIIKRDKAFFNDFAILARANDYTTPFIKALEKAGLPFQFLASKGLYSKSSVLDIIAYFKLLDNYHESLACYRILNMPLFSLTHHDVAKIVEFSRRKTISLFEAMQQAPLVSSISKEGKEKIVFLMSFIDKHSQMAKEKTVSEIFLSFLEHSGYLENLVKQPEKVDEVSQFYKKIRQFEELNLDKSLRNFMENLSLELESGEEGKLEFDAQTGPDMIKVMTIHGAKGLEFKYVFLVSMVDRRFPTIERRDPIEIPEALINDIKPKGDIHIQEERRLCYVAMTRAKKELYFTSSQDYGLQRKKKVSQFLAEMGFAMKTPIENVKLQKNILIQKEKPNIAIAKKQVNNEKLGKFSYSQLATYQRCPLQYKFQYVLKIPMKEKPVFSFGKTMHKSLFNFVSLATHSNASQNNLFAGEKKALKNKIDFKEFEKIYQKNWIDDWYESKKQKEEYMKTGKKIIKSFYEDFYGAGSAPEIFTFNDIVALEMPFHFKIGPHTIYGIIDRIDRENDGIHIIDYKTGKAKDKLYAADKQQLLIYQMALESLGYQAQKLTYYYLEENKKLSFLGSKKELDDLRVKIMEIIEKIQNGDFNPRPGHDCQYCDYRELYDII